MNKKTLKFSKNEERSRKKNKETQERKKERNKDRKKEKKNERRKEKRGGKGRKKEIRKKERKDENKRKGRKELKFCHIVTLMVSKVLQTSDVVSCYTCTAFIQVRRFDAVG